MGSWDRRKFLVRTARLAGYVFLLRALTRCGSEGSVPVAGNGNCGDGVSTTYTNPTHPHVTIDLTSSQLANGVTAAYILLSGTHQHTFSLNQSDFATLTSGGTITKIDNEGDGHIVCLRC